MWTRPLTDLEEVTTRGSYSLSLSLSLWRGGAMIRLAIGRATTAARGARRTSSSSSAAVPRRYGTQGSFRTHPERIAAEMTHYALRDARSRKSAGWYDDAMRILEQGASNLQGGGEGSAEAVAMLMLAMSTLLYERGRHQDAMEKLEAVYQSAPSLDFRVAAWEGLMGVKLESEQDINSLVSLADSLEASTSNYDGKELISGLLKLQVNAAKGLAHLVNGETESANECFDGCQDCNVTGDEDRTGNAVLSYAEYLHCTGNFSAANDMYERVVLAFEKKDVFERPSLTAANMVPEETFLAATCALGQLLSHTGKIDEAEELFTKALTKAENHFGSTHPKVGVILTCIARMFKEKAKLEGSSLILVQEGLYRRALELLKAPDFNSEVADVQMDRRDIITLARGGYAELLCIQTNRREEGERMKKWAESMWRNQRLSLAEALVFSEPSKVAVVDTRVCRVL